MGQNRFPNLRLSITKFGLFILFILLILIGIAIGIKFQLGEAQALEEVTLYFSPNSGKMLPTNTFSLIVDAKANKIGLLEVTLSFDPTVIRLTNEISTTNRLNTIVSKSTKDEANGSGIIDIALALSTNQKYDPPTGVFTFANIPMELITTDPNLVTIISFISDKPDKSKGIEIADIIPQHLLFAYENLTLLVNPTNFINLPLVQKYP